MSKVFLKTSSFFLKCLITAQLNIGFLIIQHLELEISDLENVDGIHEKKTILIVNSFEILGQIQIAEI